MLVVAFYDGANNHAPLGKVKIRASGLATNVTYRSPASSHLNSCIPDSMPAALSWC